MELREFDKKEIARKHLREFSEDFMNTLYRIMSKDNADIFTDRMYSLLFNDLQNFADKICKKQLENCLRNCENANSHLTYMNGINSAKQPKIEEL